MNAAPSPVTTVYSLLREPSLALLWTQDCTFYVYGLSLGSILSLEPGLCATDGNLALLVAGKRSYLACKPM